MSTNYTGTTGLGTALENYADGSLQDRYMPQVASVLYQKTGNSFIDAFTVISTIGPRKAVYGPIFKHQERGFFNAPITVRNSTSAGSAGASVDVTLAVADVNTTLNNIFFPQVYDTGFLKNGSTYIITAINTTTPTAPVVTLKPVLSTGVIPAFAANEKIAVTGTAWYEGSGQPPSREQLDYEYQYAMQFFKHSEKITGTAEKAQKWATKDSNGVSQEGYEYLKIRGEQQMIKMISNAMVFNEGSDVSVTGNPLQYTMQGWKPWIIANGGSVNPTAPGAFTLSQFQGINDDLDATNAGGKYVMLSGNSRQREVVAAASSQFSSNAMVYVKPDEAGSFQSKFAAQIEEEDIKAASLGVNTNVRTYTDGTRTYDFCNISAFSDPSTNNPTGYNSNYLSFLIPMNAVARTTSEAAAPLIEITYMPQVKQNGFMDVWQGGANSEFATNDVDARYIYYKAHVGQRLACPEMFGIIYA